MRFSYRLQKTASGWLAACVECDAMGEGETQPAAIHSLRAALEERMLRPDAVAPPAEEARATIELEIVTEKTSRESLDPGDPAG